MRLTFKGGVHPFEGKEMSKDCPVEKYLPKADLAYPLSQHIGAPAKPVVAKGDHVLAGQMIAEAGGFVSSPIHASVSGTVKGIEKRLTATGSMVDSIIVENDGLYEETEFTPADPAGLTREEIIGRIRDGGVVGLGGAGFPTHVKLSPKEPDKIEYILVNGAECEPYLTSDYRRMMDQPEKVVEGLKIVVGLFKNAKGCICIEDNKPDCIAKMKELVTGIPNIEVKELMTKYPQGGERTLIYAVTGREINSSMLPADAGCIVDNVETICSIYDAVALGSCHGSQTDAGVAGGGLDDDGAGLELAGSLGVIDHGLGDTVLDGAGGVEVFQLCQKLGRKVCILLDMGQLQQRGVADQLVCGSIDLAHNSKPPDCGRCARLHRIKPASSRCPSYSR